MAFNVPQLPGVPQPQPAGQLSGLQGIAPAPVRPLPATGNQQLPVRQPITGPVMTPGGGTTGAPLQGTAAPTTLQMGQMGTNGANVSYAPAARDVALRNLGTQTPAAPTALPAGVSLPPGLPAIPGLPGVGGTTPAMTPPTPSSPATAPAPAAATPGTPPAAAGTTDANGRPMRPDIHAMMASQPDPRALAEQMQAATDPAARQALLATFRQQMQAWQDSIHSALEQYHQQLQTWRDSSRGGPRTQPQDYSQAWDDLGKSEPAPVANALPDMQQQEAQRIARTRARRQAPATGA